MLIGLGTVLLAVVLVGVWPVSSDQYRSTVETSVQEAVSSVGTARLVGRTTLQGNAFRSYESTVVEDAREAVATATSDIAVLPVPDSDSARLRDEVLPLLQDSVRLIGDLGAALEGDDRTAGDAAVTGLAEVGEKLEGLR